jgi:hypothetical protein
MWFLLLSWLFLRQFILCLIVVCSELISDWPEQSIVGSKMFDQSLSCFFFVFVLYCVWLSCVGNGFPSRSSDQNCSTDHCRVGSLRFCFWSARRATWWGSFFAKLQIFALFCNLVKWHTNYSTVSNSDSSVLFAEPHAMVFPLRNH